MTGAGATDPDGLVALASGMGCRLGPAAAGRLLAYLDEMLVRNRQVNLSGIRDREQAVVLHVLDSLAPALLEPELPAPRRILDLGSGNGFPGVALAALWPEAAVTLMDRTGKKVRAIGECLRAAGLPGCEALQLDAASAPALRPDLRAAFDLVAVRAVAPPESAAPLAAPLTGPGGSLLLWVKGSQPAPDVLPGYRLAAARSYRLPEPAGRDMQVALYRRP